MPGEGFSPIGAEASKTRSVKGLLYAPPQRMGLSVPGVLATVFHVKQSPKGVLPVLRYDPVGAACGTYPEGDD